MKKVIWFFLVMYSGNLLSDCKIGACDIKRRLMLIAEYKEVFLIDIAYGYIKKYQGHVDPVSSVHFSQNPHHIISVAYSEQTTVVKTWDILSGRCIRTEVS